MFGVGEAQPADAAESEVEAVESEVEAVESEVEAVENESDAVESEVEGSEHVTKRPRIAPGPGHEHVSMNVQRACAGCSTIHKRLRAS